MTMNPGDVERSHSLRAQWLSWDGCRLRWRIDAIDGATAVQLRIDGIVFERFTVQAESAPSTFETDFDFSPTGVAELSFSVTRDDGSTVLAPWRVRYGTSAMLTTDRLREASQPMAPLFTKTDKSHGRTREIAVIVPIFNSPDLVQRCIAAVLRWSPASTRLILIDDASTDPQVGVLLDACAKLPNVVVRANAGNRGYTHSVNVGIDLAGNADVVLLNSDTEVGPRWLQSLAFAAYSDERIATSTAVSDNAGAFSVPDLEQYCPIPAHWDLTATQRAVLQQAGLAYPQLPTGNGFCMYVKRSVIARIGAMDEQAFPQGYGEENDFCQRAEQAGLRNVIAGNVFVRHARSASFGHERRASLGARGMTVLRERYPEYEAKVGATLYSFSRRVLDYRVRRTYEGAQANNSPQPRVLIVADADAKPLAGPYASFLLCDQDSQARLFTYESDHWAPVTHEMIDAATLRFWLAVFAIEAVLIDDRSTLAQLAIDQATTLDIPIVTQGEQLSGVFDPVRVFPSDGAIA